MSLPIQGQNGRSKEETACMLEEENSIMSTSADHDANIVKVPVRIMMVTVICRQRQKTVDFYYDYYFAWCLLPSCFKTYRTKFNYWHTLQLLLSYHGALLAFFYYMSANNAKILILKWKTPSPISFGWQLNVDVQDYFKKHHSIIIMCVMWKWKIFWRKPHTHILGRWLIQKLIGAFPEKC